MDYTDEQREALYCVAKMLCKNGAYENEAVHGYTEQLEAIDRATVLFAKNPDVVNVLQTLLKATEEKISDELNHAHSLLTEYENFMGIAPAQD